LGEVTRRRAAGPFLGPPGVGTGPPGVPERCPVTPRGDPDSPPYRPWGPGWVPNPARRVLVYAFHFRKIILYGDFEKATHGHTNQLRFCTPFPSRARTAAAPPPADCARFGGPETVAPVPVGPAVGEISTGGRAGLPGSRPSPARDEKL
jgi:hypothetical protein